MKDVVDFSLVVVVVAVVVVVVFVVVMDTAVSAPVTFKSKNAYKIENVDKSVNKC